MLNRQMRFTYVKINLQKNQSYKFRIESNAFTARV